MLLLNTAMLKCFIYNQNTLDNDLDILSNNDIEKIVRTEIHILTNTKEDKS